MTYYHEVDEDKENSLWAEVAFQNLEQAIADHDYALAKDIIANTKDKGFDASTMEEVLNNTPVEQFAVKSHSVWNL